MAAGSKVSLSTGKKIFLNIFRQGEAIKYLQDVTNESGLVAKQ